MNDLEAETPAIETGTSGIDPEEETRSSELDDAVQWKGERPLHSYNLRTRKALQQYLHSYNSRSQKT